MLTTIGGAAPEGDVVDLLLACHTRIRSFTDLALRLAAAQDLPATEVRAAAAQVRRYFDEALPLHALDEEESVLPRLAGKDPEVDAALAKMHSEHEAHGAAIGLLVGFCDTLAETPGRHAAIAPALADAARALAAHFERHLAPEEAVIFPAIRRLLPAEKLVEMAAEVRARRGTPAAKPQSSR